MDISRRTWIAAIKLAVVISTIAALAAVVASTTVHIADSVIVVAVAVVAFAASWIQTGRVRSTPVPMRSALPLR